MQHTIRPAREDDATPLAAVFRAAYAKDAERIADLPDVGAGVDEDIVARSVWVGEVNGAIVAGLVLELSDAVAMLRNVAVAPSARGTGLGKALIETAVEAARTAGAYRIDLATHVEMPGNVALYQRLGWVLGGQSGNKVLMTRAL